MTMSKKQSMARAKDMNMYVPDPADTSAPPRGAAVSPERRALEDIKRQTGVLERFLHDLDLKEADDQRFEDMQRINGDLVAMNGEMTQWLDMIREALKHHDNGELNARQFANEVDAAIKGWEAP